MSFVQLSDWYRVSRKTVVAMGGRSLFSYYNSLETALATIYPDYSWDRARFSAESGRAKNGATTSIDVQRKILERVGQKLGVKQVLG